MCVGRVTEQDPKNCVAHVDGAHSTGDAMFVLEAASILAVVECKARSSDSLIDFERQMEKAVAVQEISRSLVQREERVKGP